MDDVQDLDTRLKQSVRILRAWRWMSQVSENLDEVAAILTEEARDLIELGRLYPAHARKIGKLIVAYHNMIVHMKDAARAAEAELARAAEMARARLGTRYGVLASVAA